LVMAVLLVLALAIPRWSLLVLPLIVVMVQWQVDTPAPDDDVARATYWIWLIVYAVPLVVGILAGKLVRRGQSWPPK
jgi:Na+/proline symporter